MTTDSRQCYTDLPPPAPPRTGCLTRRILVQRKFGGWYTGAPPGWWAFGDPAQAQRIADSEGVTVRELLCPGCRRRADALGVWPA